MQYITYEYFLIQFRLIIFIKSQDSLISASCKNIKIARWEFSQSNILKAVQMLQEYSLPN